MPKETDPKKKLQAAADKVAKVPAIKVPNERSNFKKLLLSNLMNWWFLLIKMELFI